MSSSAKITSLSSIIKLGDADHFPKRYSILFDPNNLECDILDVHDIFPFSSPDRCIIRFGRLPENLKLAAGLFARIEVMIGRAPSTVQGQINVLGIIMEKARSLGITDIRLLRFEKFKRILNNNQYSDERCARFCATLKLFFMLMSAFSDVNFFLMDMISLEALRKYYTARSRASPEAHKTPDIDPDYFEVLKNRLPIIAYSESIPINYRLTAALLWLNLYIGLRPSELLSLKTTGHVIKKTIKGKTADFLYYGVPKLSHGGRIQTYAECYMLPGAVTAFEYLIELRQKVQGHTRSDRLFILENNKQDSSCLKYYNEQLFLKYFYDLITQDWREVTKRTIRGKAYHIPTITQYRVHLCGYLYRQGIRLHIVELGMSHLSSSMIAYYYRVEDKTFRKYHSRLDNLIRTKMNNDFDIEPHDEKGENLLRGFLLSMNQFKVYSARLEQMKEKQYEYEIERYKNSCQNLLSSELRPALSYLDRLISKKGVYRVLENHPELSSVIQNTDTIIQYLGQWEKQNKE